MLLRRKSRAWKRKEKGRAWPFGLGELRSGSSTAWAHLAGHGSNRVGQTRSAVSISLPSGYRHAYFIGNCLSKPAEDPAAARKFLREIERWPSQTSSDCSPRSSERQRLEPKTEGHTSGNASTTSLQRNFPIIVPYITDDGYGNLQSKMYESLLTTLSCHPTDPSMTRSTFVWAGSIALFTSSA
ncbi:hypothetical protein C6P46_004684 [Rhodotorula mucilaginosa]|uniref:Uncharacterized protein n=1 Tax=Rhodotorula mucilaginosa TaxID=5537 RepID=A0A9P6VZC2_RHOMI|nr:hypothetical protein C6P46_004684 [Rhodotorula mucilaginosa]